MDKYEMRCDALPPWLKWNEMSPMAMHDIHTHLSVPDYEPIHTWSVAYKLPGANRILLEFECFLKVILLVSHHNSHPNFVTLNQIPSKRVFPLFGKQSFWMLCRCYDCQLVFKCLCMQWQYGLSTYSWHISITSIKIGRASCRERVFRAV